MRVFLSYAHEDRLIGEALAKYLARARVQVWTPELELSPGENWSLKIGESLEKSDAMIVLVSPDSARSPWVQHEVEYALASPRFEGRLIVVEVRPAKHTPWILTKLQPIRYYDSPARARRALLARVRHLAKAPVNAK